MGLLGFVSGCAAIVSGQDQVVSVRVPNCPGAECRLINDNGTFYVQAPGTVLVNRKAAAPTEGRYDSTAAKLVNLETCQQPVFVLRDSDSDVYKSRRGDTTVTVLRCNDDGCLPINVAAAVTQRPMPVDAPSAESPYRVTVSQHAQKEGCVQSISRVGKETSSETRMAQCAADSYLVYYCTEGNCTRTN